MEWTTTWLEFRDKGRLVEFESGQLFEVSNIEIKDCETLERFYVKAQVCKDHAKLPDGDVPWVTDYRDEIIPEAMRIKVLGKLQGPYDAYY